MWEWAHQWCTRHPWAQLGIRTYIAEHPISTWLTRTCTRRPISTWLTQDTGTFITSTTGAASSSPATRTITITTTTTGTTVGAVGSISAPSPQAVRIGGNAIASAWAIKPFELLKTTAGLPKVGNNFDGAGVVLAALAMALGYGAAVAGDPDPGDAVRGFRYTKKFCVDCHGIDAKDQASPNPQAPTFRAMQTLQA